MLGLQPASALPGSWPSLSRIIGMLHAGSRTGVCPKGFTFLQCPGKQGALGPHTLEEKEGQGRPLSGRAVSPETCGMNCPATGTAGARTLEGGSGGRWRIMDQSPRALEAALRGSDVIWRLVLCRE